MDNGSETGGLTSSIAAQSTLAGRARDSVRRAAIIRRRRIMIIVVVVVVVSLLLITRINNINY